MVVAVLALEAASEMESVVAAEGQGEQRSKGGFSGGAGLFWYIEISQSQCAGIMVLDEMKMA